MIPPRHAHDKADPNGNKADPNGNRQEARAGDNFDPQDGNGKVILIMQDDPRMVDPGHEDTGARDGHHQVA